jgi:hypothetical protein
MAWPCSGDVEYIKEALHARLCCATPAMHVALQGSIPKSPCSDRPPDQARSQTTLGSEQPSRLFTATPSLPSAASVYSTMCCSTFAASFALLYTSAVVEPEQICVTKLQLFSDYQAHSGVDYAIVAKHHSVDIPFVITKLPLTGAR